MSQTATGGAPGMAGRGSVTATVLALAVLLTGCGGGSATTPPAGGGGAGGNGGYHSPAPTGASATQTPAATGGGLGSGLKSLLPGTAGTGTTGGGTGGGSGTVVGSPSQQPAATRTTTASTAAFSTPSKNIACWMEASSARCDIAERTWTAPPKPASCQLDYGNGLFLAGGRAGIGCAGDTVLGQDRVLAYGQAIRTGSVVCAASTTGVRCADVSTGHGFVLAKEGFQLF